jgi:hypothetical protein
LAELLARFDAPVAIEPLTAGQPAAVLDVEPLDDSLPLSHVLPPLSWLTPERERFEERAAIYEVDAGIGNTSRVRGDGEKCRKR